MLKQFVRGRSVYAHAINNLLENEKFSFGEPWTLTTESLSAVIPILQNSVRNRGYLVAQEISGDKISVTDTGQIGKLKVKLSNVDKPVFVRAGTVFKGQSTQSRIVGTGMVLDAEKESSIDVFCVHASHGISRDSGFSIDKVIGPRNIEDVLTSPTKSQSRVWAAASVRKRRASIRACPMCGSGRFVQSYDAELVCMDCGQSVPGVSTKGNFMDNDGSRAVSLGDDLVANLREMNEFNQKIDDMLSKVPADLQNQVGIVMIDSKGVYGLEMFDDPDSWRGFSKSIVRNYADVLAKERSGEGLFALKVERIPEEIKKFLQKAKDLSETSVFKNNVGETKTLSGKLIGEYSTLEHDLMHLILKRNVAV